MASALGRLLGRRGASRTSQELPSADGPPVDIDALPLEGTLGAPPALVPAAIYRQPLFAPNELTPGWLRPRPAPAPYPARSSGTMVNDGVVAEMASTIESKPTKRPRRPTANGPSGTSRPRAKRGAKTDHEPNDR